MTHVRNHAVLLMLLALILTTITGCEEAIGGGSNNDGGAVTGGEPSQSFIDRHAEVGDTPEGAFKLWIEAAVKYDDTGVRQEMHRRIQHLTLPLDSDDWATRNSTATFVTRLQERNYIFRSYAEGATPENSYEMDPNDFTLNVDEDQSGPDMFGDRGYALFVISGGADSPRPVYLMERDGLYYVDTYSNIYVDIRSPQ